MLIPLVSQFAKACPDTGAIFVCIGHSNDCINAYYHIYKLFIDEPNNNPNHVIGALSGLLAVAVVAIVVLSLIVMVLWRRNPS